MLKNINTTLLPKVIIIALVTVLFTSCSGSSKDTSSTVVKEEYIVEKTSHGFVFRLNEKGHGLVREVPADIGIASKDMNMYIGVADVRWVDCEKDLTEEQKKSLIDCAPHIIFNSDTVFPKTLMKDFDPNEILEAGKNPGLGIHSLHKNGITGSGVSIAIIDQVLYTGHPEYSDQLAFYEEIHVAPNEGASMHGSGVSSIAVGKSCGVAPDAKLYYWAVNFSKDLNNIGDDDTNIAFADGLAVAIDRILEVNNNLPENEKIRVISISRAFDNLEDEGVQVFLSAVERAKDAGIFVITTSTFRYYDWLNKDNDFAGLGKEDYAADPDKLSNYTLGRWEQSNPNYFTSNLLVPMDARSVADYTQGNGYVFFSDGGWSWVAPYVAGLYALACQINPDVTPEEFFDTALDTADELTVKIRSDNGNGEEYTFNHIINPVKLIESLEDD